MDEGPIAFVDSGVGGLAYLENARRRLPRERFVYAADRLNFPYGPKSAEEVTRAVVSLTGAIARKENPKLVVVACNTASVVSLAELRGRFPFPFVGVVPAVKPAAELSKSKRIGVLATEMTVRAGYLRDLVQRFADGCVVTCLPSGDLVEFVEYELYKSNVRRTRARVRTVAEEFRNARVDAVVLASTHFVHLGRAFEAELGEGIRIVDSREGVTAQVERLLGEKRALSSGVSPGGSLYLSGPGPIEERYLFFARKFGLEIGGTV